MILCITHDVNAISAKQRKQQFQKPVWPKSGTNAFVIMLKKTLKKWKVNESLRKVKSKTVDRALLCGASRVGGLGGEECERKKEEAGDSEWKARSGEAENEREG